MLSCIILWKPVPSPLANSRRIRYASLSPAICRIVHVAESLDNSPANMRTEAGHGLPASLITSCKDGLVDNEAHSLAYSELLMGCISSVYCPCSDSLA